MLEKILGYGKIGASKTMADGSIRFCARIARANRDYKYRNRDGTIRTERITPEELFKPQSLDTLKLLPIVHPHAPQTVDPSNYHKYAVGSTGDVPVRDGDFLVVSGHLRRQDAIDAFNTKKARELSPGYYRELSPPQGEVYQQLDRRYIELALVPYARGGRELRIDGTQPDGSTYWQFDADEAIADWDDTVRDDKFYERLLTYGRLDPPPVILPQTIMAKISIGKNTIEVAADSIDAAVAAKTEYDKLCSDASELTAFKAKLDALERTKADELTVLKAKSDAFEVANTQLTQKLSDSTDIKPKIIETIASLQKESRNLALLTAKGIDTKDAKVALDNCDLEGYKKAIVAKISPTTNQDSVDVYYNAYVAAISKDMTLVGEPSGVGAGANYPTIGNFAMPAGIDVSTGTNGLFAHYLSQGQSQMVSGTATGASATSALPPDDVVHGWM